MKQNSEQMQVNSVVNLDSSNTNNSLEYQQKREKIKLKLVEKFNISLDDAERFLIKFEEKNQNKFYHSKNDDSKKQLQTKNNSNNLIKSDVNKHNSREMLVDSVSIPKRTSDNVVKTKQSEVNNKYFDDINRETDVDSILTDIIPNYNQQISIKLKHVDLTFEVQNEKVDTLKESFIRLFSSERPNKVKINALNDINFEIYKGEKVGIIGYNGAGKSTMLKVISGIYPPDHGDVITNGKISPLLSLGAGFDMNFSGRRNIFLNGAVLGYDKEFLESKLNEIIEFSELGDFIDIPIKNYSSGMLAKLGFSIATVVNPDILIIDEVLGVGDATFSKKSADKIQSLMDGGTTVVLVSHSIPQIRSLCDKAIWVDQGKIREIGEVNKVCDHYLKDAEKASNEQLANIQFR